MHRKIKFSSTCPDSKSNPNLGLIVQSDMVGLTQLGESSQFDTSTRMLDVEHHFYIFSQVSRFSRLILLIIFQVFIANIPPICYWRWAKGNVTKI